MRTMLFTDCVNLVGSACKPFEGEKYYVSTGAVDNDHIDYKNIEIIDYSEKPSRANLEVKNGDVLFAKMQGTKKTLLIDERLSNNIYSTGFCAVRAKDDILTTKCLYYILISEIFLNQKDNNCSGATQRAITNSGLKKIALQVPDLRKQESITNQLDLITSIINKRQQELQKLDELIKARFIEMFGKVKTKKVDDVCESFKIGPFGSALHKNEISKEGFAFVLGTDNAVKNKFVYDEIRYITEDKYNELIKYKVNPGDVIMSMMGTVGRTSVIPENIGNAIVSSHLCIIRTNKDIMHPEFFQSAFHLDDYIESQIDGIHNGSIMKGFNLKIVKAFDIKCPSLEQQNEFLCFKKQVDKSKVAIQKSLDLYQELFDKLMNDYFGD